MRRGKEHMSKKVPHEPVMLAEVIAALEPADGGIYVDGTFGAGGYTRAILEAARCRVIAIDRDPRAIAIAETLAETFGERLSVVPGLYADMDALIRARGVDAVDGVALDIGVSSMQIDEGARGFSFLKDGPLDMRMGGSGETAADLVNEMPERELADLLYTLGEERRSRRIAKAIVEARSQRPIAGTLELAEIVEKAIGRGGDIHPATRTFQALRIRVNDELGQLRRGLSAAERLLKPAGRLVVVSFHSLEDRIVKRFLADRSGNRPGPSRHQPVVEGAVVPPSFRLVTRRPIMPGAKEIARNPRARSARLRAAVRTDARPLPLEDAA